ncbi:Glycosyl transferase group 1 [Bifidobacterium hapali]|uniref:Glycosyl transferase group 1 n=1 Tax=Bifidobacterium hapali TaxID=1630172 RepID=A0A261G2C7_9BIFI|nr:glycosyltransferase [Bifidobacterium hapali]OZG65395.1 Glycosyl transferase group 1 [Bifidobacterium hapali]
MLNSKHRVFLFTVYSLSLGGIQRVTSTIVNLLNELHFNVFILKYSLDNNLYQVKTGLLEHKITLFNIFLIKLVHKLGLLDFFNYSFLSYFVKKKNASVVVLGPESFFFVKNLKGAFPSLKIYLWMHNNFDIYKNNERYFGGRFDELVKNVSAADGIICLESYTALKWRQYNNNVVVIHNPVTIHEHENKADLDVHIISFTGRLLVEQKGLDYLVEIASRLPEGWRISVAGAGVDEDKFRELIDERNLADKFILRGALNGDDLTEHYLQSSIFVLTSRWEGFPLVTVEAMSLGLPVVAFGNPGLDEVTDHGKYGLLAKDGDVDDFVDKLMSLISDRDLREKYSGLSLERAKAFAPEVIIKDWEKILNS